jgi:glucose-1-phosphate thymidylyltransferase
VQIAARAEALLSRYLSMVLKGLITPGLTAAHRGASSTDPSGAGLQRVANRPIVCHVLDRLRDAGVREAALVVPMEASTELQMCLAAEGPAEVSVRCFVYDHDALGAALALAIAFLDEAPCIVHPPDGLLAEPLTSFARRLSADRPDLVVLVRKGSGETDSIGLATRRLLRLAGEGTQPAAVLGLSGICLFGPGGLRLAQEVGWRTDRESDLVAVAERLVAGGGTVHIEYVESWSRFTGNSADLLDLNRIVLDELGPQIEPIPGSHNRIEGRVVVHPTASVQSSVLIGPAIVGPGALVVESYIGPYTSIGAHARIEGAEVERSIILAGASIMHVGGRLVASVVGREARIARDFSLPRAMRLNVGDGGEVVLC